MKKIFFITKTLFCLSTALLILALTICPVYSQKKSLAAQNQSLVLDAEKLLSERGYWIISIDGKKDASTFHAITAFQKVEGRKRTGILTATELAAIAASARPGAFFPISSAHIEINITRQVLFLVDAGNLVIKILPVSTGSEERYFSEGRWQTAHTPRGAFQITRQIKGVRRAPLGTLYDPNYFSGGVAIHGSNSIPFSPASHGCVRIPRFASKEFREMVYVGMNVFVFDEDNRMSFAQNEKNENDNQPCGIED